ncbi:MAG: Ser/Thr protein kinase RdoA (MazF antagonist) [Candidatus Nanohaloarchaea archaeon]|jgi:Ser/Thr protein kinase RdoA (MazF antagonist)
MREEEASELIGRFYSIEDVEHLDSDNFRFEDTKGERIARFDPDNGGLGGPFANIDNSVEQQGEIYRALNQESNVPVPGLRGIHTDVEEPFVAVEVFDGEELDDIFELKDGDNYPNQETVMELFEMIGESVGEAHQIGFDEFGKLQAGGEVDPSWPTAYDWLGYAIETQVGFATDSPVIEPQELEKVESYMRGVLSEHEEDLRDYEDAVQVISDVHPGNILVSDDYQSICFHDLEYGRAGMPVEDIYRMKSELAGIHEEALPEDSGEAVEREKAYEALMNGYERKADYDELNQSLEESGLPFMINLMSLIEYYERKDPKEDKHENRQEALKSCLNSTVEEGSPVYRQYRGEVWN